MTTAATTRRLTREPYLLDPQRRRAFDTLFPILLAGYLFMDKTFAYFHIPGTPIFVGEIVLLFGIAGAFKMLTWGPAWRNSNIPLAIAIYGGWSLVRTIPGLLDEPIDALRDAVLWAYLLVAFAVLAVLVYRPLTLPRWLRGYRKIIPYALIWLPLTIFIESTSIGQVPDSDVDFTSFNPGKSEVHLLMIIAFVWLVWSPKSAKDNRFRIVVTGGAILGLLVLATKGRGGFVAAMLGASLVFLFHHSRTKLVLVGAGSLVVIAVAIVAINPQVELGRRDVSASQLTNNVTSIVTGQGQGDLEDNIDWRLNHWATIWAGVNGALPLTGHGFGDNIALIYHIPQEDIGLRNAHNSHLTVFARAGWIGLLAWVGMWALWFVEVNAARRRLAGGGLVSLSGLAAWAIAAMAAMHVDAFFDPAIEGPQFAFWLWAVFGIGLYLSIATRRRYSVRARRGVSGRSDMREDLRLIDAEIAAI